MENGWGESAGAWIASQGEEGDYGRRFVLDAPMLARVAAAPVRAALDVGCGEGRFCRLLRARGIAATGIDPTEALLEEARRRDPGGDYRPGRAEALPAPDAAFDLVVSYLSLIDIPDAAAGITEMARVLAPGGRLLIANLNPFFTAGMPDGWVRRGEATHFAIDRYLEERAEWVGWRGIRIRNWHRPMHHYMTLLLGRGLVLTHFDEPAPREGGDPHAAARYRRVPYFHIMEWCRPAVSFPP
ncbi:class I SAM-dependent methyltransferase [Falsiroseomonas selenitidurans]|uniref:Class I SAM-dependent methyltransferase n=1 Tax=Falsiroseomonas selenitidurans TaxID=2716335 RepID=A0ABX1E5D6_9PROT|nr:class I SAM-dependent methyltransferase [Falsiroseomonas selenitidurans]NKC32394.1 class I SAM-dependent methyltransferase [Falsiroseomonas selenitidurans]